MNNNKLLFVEIKVNMVGAKFLPSLVNIVPLFPKTEQKHNYCYRIYVHTFNLNICKMCLYVVDQNKFMIN